MVASTSSRVTTDHDAIRRWAEERGAKPVLARKSDGDPGSIRLEFPGSRDTSLREIELGRVVPEVRQKQAGASLSAADRGWRAQQLLRNCSARESGRSGAGARRTRPQRRAPGPPRERQDVRASSGGGSGDLARVKSFRDRQPTEKIAAEDRTSRESREARAAGTEQIGS